MTAAKHEDGSLASLWPLAAFGVPALLGMLAWGYGGWRGAVPAVVTLAALGITAVLVPDRGAWRWIAETSQREGGPPVIAWRRALPRAGAGALAVAVGMVWLLAG